MATKTYLPTYVIVVMVVTVVTFLTVVTVVTHLNITKKEKVGYIFLTMDKFISQTWRSRGVPINNIDTELLGY